MDAAIAEAERLELLNDRVFARLWIEDRLSHRPLACPAMRRELLDRGIDAEIVDQALSEVCPREKETAIALNLARERFAELRAADPEARARRTVSYLTRRGFSVPEALRIVRSLEKTESTSKPPDRPEGTE